MSVPGGVSVQTEESSLSEGGLCLEGRGSPSGGEGGLFLEGRGSLSRGGGSLSGRGVSIPPPCGQITASENITFPRGR